MTPQQITDALEDNEVLLECCYSVRAFALSGGSLGEFYEDVIEGVLHSSVQQACPRLWALTQGEDLPEPEDAADALSFPAVRGFVWKFATPVRRYSSDSGWSSSWGHYTFTLIYSDTFEGACGTAFDWFQERDAKWRAEVAA